MSEKKRQKKDGQNKDKKTQAMREAVSERKQGAPAPRQANAKTSQTGPK